MQSRARLVGHPIHPMLIVFPLGLLTTAVVFDLVFFLTRDPVFAEVAFWNITAGLIGGLVAAGFGVIDYLGIPRATRARRIGLLHGLGNLGVMLLFLAAWLTRLTITGHAADAAWFAVEIVALALSGVTAWMGGELVDRLGVGVDERAGVDAPSSLAKGRPGPAAS